MSYRKYSRAELRWYHAGFLTISNKIEKEIRKTYDDDGELKHVYAKDKKSFLKLKWRLGYNQYKAGYFKEAITTLTMVVDALRAQQLDASRSMKKRAEQDITDPAHLHQVIGQAGMYLFLSSGEHSHLETSYEHYQFAVDHIQANLVAMFKLPSLLLDYARVLEYYGSFETSMSVYSQILTKFPNFTGYFTALYRTAVVGRHLASLCSEPQEKQDTVDKCIDILQFLLEALPANVNEVHIVFQYARSLELSSDASTRFRAQNIYRSLHGICKKYSLALAHDIQDSKLWSADPRVWWELASYFDSFHEYIIAKDAYVKFIDLTKKNVKVGKDLSSVLSLQECLVLSTSYAKYQSYTEAVKYAEIGLQIDKYNMAIRNLLGKWNANYSSSLSKEIDAVGTIRRMWKYRCWSYGYMKRLKRNLIDDMQRRLKKNYFDLEARQALAYYAKRQYRYQFMYEEECATKIQRWFRVIKKYMIWMEAQRLHYSTIASEMVEEMERKKEYYNALTRSRVVLFAKNKFIYKNHPLRVVAKRMVQENRASVVMFRALRVFHLKRVIDKRIHERINYQTNKYINNIILLQSFVRIVNAKRKRLKVIRERKRQNEAASKIQKFYRAKKMSFRYAVLLVLHREYRRRVQAMRYLKKRLPKLIQHMRQRRAAHYKELEKKNRKRKARMQKLEQGTNVVQAAVRIQHFFCNWYYSRQLRKYSSMLQPRKKQEFNHSYAEKVQFYLKNPQFKYCNPGIDKTSAAYVQMLSTPVVVCGQEMLPSDYMLLGSILKHPQSNISTILLHSTSFVYNINEDIITHYTECVRKNVPVQYNPLGQEYSPTEKSMIYFFYSLMKSISLRSIHIIGGRYHPNILKQLFKMIQLDNARIEEVVIHTTAMYHAHSVNTHALSHVLVSSATQLLLDYFNYSLQGIKRLCFHNVGIGDDDVDILCGGLKINPSLQSLHLSRNIITDRGFLRLFTTLLDFSNTRVQLVDLSCNLIAFKEKTIRTLLTDYRKEKHPNLMNKNITLVWNVSHNLILHRIDIVDLSVDQHILPQLEVIYDGSDGGKSAGPTEDAGRRTQGEHKGRNRRAVTSSEDKGEIDRVLMHKMRKMHRLPMISGAGSSQTRSGVLSSSTNVSLPAIKGAKAGDASGRMLLSKSLKSF